MGRMSKRGKRGQIWVETVIYTLIAFVMIGAVLALAQPKVQQLQDKALIEQSMGIMSNIDSLLTSLDQGGPGNKREIELGINKGELKIDGVNESLTFEIDGSYAYSEPGEDITVGNTIVHTTKKGDTYTVDMTQDRNSTYNFKYNDADALRIISAASTPYDVFMSNEGQDSSGKTIINFIVE
jgi:type II secretory pathway pseudopilin PulG